MADIGKVGKALKVLVNFRKCMIENDFANEPEWPFRCGVASGTLNFVQETEGNVSPQAAGVRRDTTSPRGEVPVAKV